MDRGGEFTINGIHSREINSLIQERPLIPTPERDIELKEVAGVSGSYVFDNESYKNSPVSLNLFALSHAEHATNSLKDKIKAIFSTGKYMDIVFYHEKDKVYQAITTAGPDFELSGQTPLLLPYTVDLSFRPFKYSLDAFFVEGGSDLEFENPTFFEAEPLITIYGSGDITLKVNGKDFVFKDVDDYIKVDSEVKHAYKEQGNIFIDRDDRMYTNDFPLLKPGLNQLSITHGTATFDIEPRWRSLV